MDTLRELTAAELRASLARRRISASELARRLGWSQAYMARRVDGRIALNMDDLEKIVEELGVPITDLLPRDRVRPNQRSGVLTDRPMSGPPRVKSRPNSRPRRDSTRPVSTEPPTLRRTARKHPTIRPVAA